MGWLKERRQRKKALELLHESSRDLVKVYVELALVEVDMEARQYLDGTILHCVYCGKRFFHNNQHCALGFCQECS